MANTPEFLAAAEKVKTLPVSPGNADLLQLYGLFKQATSGDVDTPRPGVFDVKNKAKWDAWKEKEGIKPEEAETLYMALVEKLSATAK
ncbi:hypothetical protein BGZ65_000639 [Modicella reniformis]|uniref:ACB domain-containing protein n=1 Tax=Modicella reniformis TaxID=1440133 RepID=A0A9P6IM13_9FUNG|nr:hypothetical protein BGZ65_000639 [Modicella reniformis]